MRTVPEARDHVGWLAWTVRRSIEVRSFGGDSWASSAPTPARSNPDRRSSAIGRITTIQLTGRALILVGTTIDDTVTSPISLLLNWKPR